VLPGPAGKVALRMAVDAFHKMGKATDYDVVVSDALATVLSGEDTDLTQSLSEDDVLQLEQKSFLQLVRQRGTADRISHMLETGKPLRN
jgi:3-hydroxyacyl-CoA dehydrogenase